ncbi:hypothetical protein [Ruminococcus sp.]|uniref:hypothetical protein n=1 Tax=Ruminococcus sp. TaxID=41978 RepID=UPI0025F4843C|nr:hypothetical protein [Ruminococcus sp.]MBR1432688.1 hypothetical protein [Ruminococcus sp.]
MKQFIYGALSAFSVVAAYHLIKKMSDRKKTSAAASNSIPDNLFWEQFSNRDNKIIYDRSKLKNPNANGFIFGKSGTGKEVYPENKEQIKPKRVSFNKEYIEERKELQTPSGVALISSRKKGIFFFKHEIQNVIENTDDKIVIFDYLEYFKPVLSSLGVDYTEISKDEQNEDIMEKYERSIGDKNAELPYIAPLTERITCFNVQNKEDVEAALRYVFMRSKATVGKEYPKRVWLYIPSHQIAHYHAKQLYTLMKRSRMAGVIMTAAAEMDSLIIDESVRLIANMQDYLAFTDDIDKYYVSDTLRELICRVDKAYQFDINISLDEENELKCRAFELGHIMTNFL